MSTKNHRTTRSTPSKGARALTLQRVSQAQIRHLATPRTGYEAFVDLFEKLVAEHGDELGTGIDVDAMRTAVQNAQSLTPALADARDRVALLSNTQLVQSSNGWTEMLLIYGRAQQAARTNSQIEVAIESFAKFMKHGPRAKKATTTP